MPADPFRQEAQDVAGGAMREDEFQESKAPRRSGLSGANPLGRFFGHSRWTNEDQSIDVLGVPFRIGDAQQAAHAVPRQYHAVDLLFFAPSFQRLDEKVFSSLNGAILLMSTRSIVGGGSLGQRVKIGPRGQAPPQLINGVNLAKESTQAHQVAVKVGSSVHYLSKFIEIAQTNENDVQMMNQTIKTDIKKEMRFVRKKKRSFVVGNARPKQCKVSNALYP